MYREEIVKEYVDKKIERNDDGEFAWSVDDSINFYKKIKKCYKNYYGILMNIL